VNTYHYVLYAHFLSLFLGLGAGSVLLTCLFQLRNARTVQEAAPWGRVSAGVARLFAPAILGLFGTGAYMTSDLWTWSTRWIDIAIAGLVVVAIQGGGVAEQTAKRLEAAMHANGPGPLGPECRRMSLHPGLWVMEFTNLGIVLGIVWDMTQKPGLGESLAAVLVGYAVGAALALYFSRVPQEELAPAGEAAS
jgi:hypothetical protein